MRTRTAVVLISVLAGTSLRALDGFTPADGFAAFELGITGSALAVAPDGRFALAQDAPGGGARVDVYDTYLPGRSLLGSIFAPDGHTWRFITDVEWLADGSLLIAENGDMDTVYSATLTGGASALAPIGSVPDAAAVTVGFGGDVLASAAGPPGTGAVYRITSGAASPFASGLGVGYVGGLAFRDGLLYLADTNDPDFLGNPGLVLALNAAGAVVDTISLAGGGGSGAFDIAFDTEGDLLATTGATVTGAGQPLGSFSGLFPFPTSLAYTGEGFEPYAGAGVLVVNGTFTDVGGVFAVTPVPEPFVLFGAPLLLLWRRRR